VMSMIEEKYRLTAINRDNAGEVKLPTVAEVRKSREHGTPITRVEIQQALETVAPTVQTLEQLQEALFKVGIDLMMAPAKKPSPKKRKKQPLSKIEDASTETEQPESGSPDEDPTDSSSLLPSSISSPVIPLLFSKDGLTFSASQLGRKYTWKGLQTNFGLMTQQALSEAGTKVVEPIPTEMSDQQVHSIPDTTQPPQANEPTGVIPELASTISKPSDIPVKAPSDAPIPPLESPQEPPRQPTNTIPLAQPQTPAEEEQITSDDIPATTAELEPFNSYNERAYFKRLLEQIREEISQEEPLRPSYEGDLQVTLYALSRYSNQSVLKILSQSKTAQEVARKKGIPEVKLYLQQLLKAAQERQLQRQRQQRQDQER
jgi:hypothetical protein